MAFLSAPRMTYQQLVPETSSDEAGAPGADGPTPDDACASVLEDVNVLQSRMRTLEIDSTPVTGRDPMLEYPLAAGQTSADGDGRAKRAKGAQSCLHIVDAGGRPDRGWVVDFFDFCTPQDVSQSSRRGFARAVAPRYSPAFTVGKLFSPPRRLSRGLDGIHPLRGCSDRHRIWARSALLCCAPASACILD